MILLGTAMTLGLIAMTGLLPARDRESQMRQQV